MQQAVHLPGRVARFRRELGDRAAVGQATKPTHFVIAEFDVVWLDAVAAREGAGDVCRDELAPLSAMATTSTMVRGGESQGTAPSAPARRASAYVWGSSSGSSATWCSRFDPWRHRGAPGRGRPQPSRAWRTVRDRRPTPRGPLDRTCRSPRRTARPGGRGGSREPGAARRQEAASVVWSVHGPTRRKSIPDTVELPTKVCDQPRGPYPGHADRSPLRRSGPGVAGRSRRSVASRRPRSATTRVDLTFHNANTAIVVDSQPIGLPAQAAGPRRAGTAKP